MCSPRQSRARKVKCDESFPVCQKCLTTGRICDGYGVWGGGGNQYGRRQVSRSPRDVLSIPPVAGMATLVAGMDEKALFDWFQRRAIVKLPGSYFSDLWTKFILQVSHNEQAVWHAILAVSSTHRVGFVDISSATASELEHSTLQHLSKAVQHLHPHFCSRDKASFTVVLIACIALITLDLLRGHFASAQVHLRNGLNILAEAQYSFHSKACSSDRVLLLSNDSLDSLIAEAFLRLSIQVELLQNPGRPRPCLLAPHLQPSLVEVNHSTPQFSSYIAVWHSLGPLINDVFHPLYTRPRTPNQQGRPHHPPKARCPSSKNLAQSIQRLPPNPPALHAPNHHEWEGQSPPPSLELPHNAHYNDGNNHSPQ